MAHHRCGNRYMYDVTYIILNLTHNVYELMFWKATEREANYHFHNQKHATSGCFSIELYSKSLYHYPIPNTLSK